MSQPAHNVPSPSPLVFPDRLYGRASESAALMHAFSEVGAGAGRVLLLPGHSGSGKTALVQSLRHPVEKKNGFFLEGKFNQYQQGIPLFSLRQALHQLARELRATDPSAQQRWKTHILEAVGGLGRLLTELSPEWEALLGAQPPVPEISPYEAPHRFALVLRQFLGVFCRAEHPVVLFIDDWQWADAASLIVLQQLQVGTSLRYLLVVAAYRDNEVDSTHPFLGTVEELRRQAVPIATLPVLDLELADVRSLVSDTLTPATEDVDRLTSFLHATTHGNPFFLRSLLESLHARRALWFEPSQSCWRWNGRSLVAHDGAEDVVQLFVQNLRRLSAECRHLLSVAACLGNRFDLEALAMVSGLSSADCLRRLSQALEQRVILPCEGEQSQYLFQHDRVQQAAHSLIARDQLPAVRLKIARLLLEQLTPRRLEERLLEVADHFNAGRALLRGEAEQGRLAELNIAAGRKARAATAYQAALQFHRVAGEALARPECAGTFWKEHHEQALQFFKDWAESEFLEGQRTQAEACIREALDHAQTPLEKADALCVLILQNTLLARYPDAIAAGRRALGELGITLPESDFEAARDAAIAQVRRRLAGRAIASLRDVPPMSDPTMLMATRVLITMGPPCYRSHQRLWSVLVPTVVDLTLQYGPVPQIGYSHTAFGGLLGWVDNDYATAEEFGELATSLMREVFTAPTDQSVFHLMVGSSTRHWFTHLRAASEDYAHAWEAGLRSGNLQYAAYAFGHNMYCRFYQGIPLDRLIEESQRSLAFSRTRTNQWAIDLLEGGLQVFGSLAGREISASWQETTYLQEVDAHQNIQVACIYRALKAFSLLILGDPERALAVSDEAEPLIYTVGTQGLLPWPEHVFTRLLILATLHPRADANRQATWRGEMDRVVARLEVWAAHAPENYRFKLAMARAEIAGLEGRPGEALELYEQAAEAAHTGHFIQWEAWAHERAAQLALACGEESLAHGYWQNAYYAYHRWGALAKAGRLEQNFLSKTVGTRQENKSIRAHRERFVERLRAQAARLSGAPSPLDESELLKELTAATNHLREEVAHRKEVEAELQQRRDQLTQEIAARTKDLKATQELARESAAQAKQLAAHQQALLETQAATLNLVEDATSARNRAEQANAALLESNARYELVLEGAGGGIWDWDVPNRRIHFSARWKQMRGYAANELSDSETEWSGNIHPEDAPRVMAAVREHFEGRTEFFEEEYRVRRKDGSYLWVLDRGKAVRDAAGQVVRMAGSEINITERKQAEESLRANNDRLQQTLAELKSAQDQVIEQERLRALGTMASGIAHDFNNLLASILGVSELFIHRPEILQDKEQTTTLLPLLHTAAKDARDVVRRLREFYRNRDADETFASVKLTDIIDEAISLSRPRWQNQAQASGATITIATDCHPETPCVTGNAAELRETIINLIFNAVDAMPHGGNLNIRTRTEAGAPMLEVTDNGTGMTEEVQRHCLEPFYTTKGEHGSGLGLAMVYGTMTRHKGRINITSAVGTGTTVRLCFPPPTAQHPVRRAGAKPTKMTGLRILLVDDLPSIRTIVGGMLTADRHLVETAPAGNEALSKLKQTKFDVLITDRAMPGLSGDQLAVMAKKAHRHLKVIMLTGFGEIMQTTGEHPPGVDLLLSKPVELAELRQALLTVYTHRTR
jgi:PAS domain S-box-containing protein